MCRKRLFAKKKIKNSMNALNAIAQFFLYESIWHLTHSIAFVSTVRLIVGFFKSRGIVKTNVLPNDFSNHIGTQKSVSIQSFSIKNEVVEYVLNAKNTHTHTDDYYRSSSTQCKENSIVFLTHSIINVCHILMYDISL